MCNIRQLCHSYLDPIYEDRCSAVRILCKDWIIIYGAIAIILKDEKKIMNGNKCYTGTTELLLRT